MAAYAAGDMAAHHALYRRLAPQIRGVALKALRDPAAADDILQRTFLQVHRARHDFRVDAPLRPWVFTIAMNLVRDALRRRKRRRETPWVLTGPLEPAVQPASTLEREEEAALLHEALTVLPDDQRRAIEMHWWEGRPFAEVARLEGVSVSAVKVRAHRGYRRMREWLETTGHLTRT